MKKMYIYEPAMCCSTGLCGPSTDQNLLRISIVINNLKSNGIIVERFNLSSNPDKFVESELINNLINKDGSDVLPVTVVDGEVVKIKEYPTNQEIASLLNITEDKLAKVEGCGCSSGCC